MSGKSKKVKGTKQTLEFIEEPKKFHVKSIKCKNARQKEFLKCMEEKEITLCTGLAGSGKSYVSLYFALKQLEKGLCEKIVLVKSVTNLQGEDIGYLPGSIHEKMDPYMMSFYGNIDKIIGEEWRKKLVGEKKIQIQPLAYIRGINIDNAIVLLDETQNLDLNTFRSIITRIGSDSKYVIMGDIEQIDRKNKQSSVLSKLVELFHDSESVGTITFTDEDCIRNPIIPYILEKLRTLE